MSLGAFGLNIGLVVVGLVTKYSGATEVFMEIIALTSALTFLLGFAPPRTLRFAWRQPEQEELGRAAEKLMCATTVTEVATLLLPHAIELVGGSAGAVKDTTGSVVASCGEGADVIERSADGRRERERAHLVIPLETPGLASLVVWTSLYTPFFGRDEVEMLRGLAAVADLAFERCRLLRERGERRFRSLVQNSTDVITLVDAGGAVKFVSPSVEPVAGYRSDEVIGRNLFDTIHPEDVGSTRDHIREALGAEGGLATLDFRMRNANGAWRWVEGSASNLLHDPDVAAVVINYRDVTERKALEDQLTHQAFHDPLTNLANRALFRNRLEHALSHQNRNHALLAVMFMDIDDFKMVNDSLGHEAGDKLLVEVAKRLQATLRSSDTAARLGGDEFALLVEILSHPEDTAKVAERVIEAVREPFEVVGRHLSIHASVGIAIAVPGHEDTDQLLRNADVAMYRAKSHGKGRYEFYEPAMHTAVLERLELKADLEEALANQEFVLHYQPIVALDEQRIVGLEALLRWRHSTKGMIAPARFIPLAEDTGLIVPLGRWVLWEACRQTRSWQLRHGNLRPLSVAVNLSAKQLADAGLVRDVRACLRESGLAANDLTLEITESLLMEDIAVTLSRLTELKEVGVMLAVDDFGTGYSSLSYLQRFPIDRLKIDKAFVDGVGFGDERSALARAVVQLGDSLNLSAVAEGIETSDQVSELVSLKCEFGQGYYFAKPLPPEAIDAMLDRHDRMAPGESAAR
jgi:diguanylate cyclase (GGDEF)-like protein/PAS domain S-box-containing protein